MSRNRFFHKVLPAIPAVVVAAAAPLFVTAAAVGSAAQPASRMKRVEPRQIVRTVVSRYTISQAGQPIGSESVTRHEFNDNSVEFISEVELEFSNGASTSLTTDLTLERETFFPISFETTKTTLQQDLELSLAAQYEWYSNVAVIQRTSRGSVDTMRVVLPAGAAIVDMNVAHHLYVPLYWYDTDVGGVQAFNVVDPWTAKPYTASLRLQTNEAITLKGEEIEISRYEFVRERLNYKIYVDANGRIVKVDQDYFLYELAEWSEQLNGEE